MTPPIESLEGLYGLTFTDREKALITALPGALTPIDAQRAYLLKLALQRLYCPGCNGITCRLAACTLRERFSEMETGPATGWGAIPDDSYECPLCTARLKYHMSLIAGFDFFTLQPGQTILVPDVPPTPGAPR
jgi:hypothetical protein